MRKPAIALTFDDGPNITLTPKVLDVLEENKAVATFFYIGQEITDEAAPVMRRAAAMGCEIGNHSFTHDHMPDLSEEKILEEVEKTSAKIREVLGKAPTFFRPPFFEYNDIMLRLIDMPFITGEGIEDWEESVTVSDRIERTLALAEDGAIILLHDFPGNEKTLEAIKTIIPALKEKGFDLVTVPQLFDSLGKTPENRVVYTKV